MKVFDIGDGLIESSVTNFSFSQAVHPNHEIKTMMSIRRFGKVQQFMTYSIVKLWQGVMLFNIQVNNFILAIAHSIATGTATTPDIFKWYRFDSHSQKTLPLIFLSLMFPFFMVFATKDKSGGFHLKKLTVVFYLMVYPLEFMWRKFHWQPSFLPPMSKSNRFFIPTYIIPCPSDGKSQNSDGEPQNLWITGILSVKKQGFENLVKLVRKGGYLNLLALHVVYKIL